ncbi:hypothetical protein MHYP_G00186450 [Metynnis hypsauchen]
MTSDKMEKITGIKTKSVREWSGGYWGEVLQRPRYLVQRSFFFELLQSDHCGDSLKNPGQYQKSLKRRLFLEE